MKCFRLRIGLTLLGWMALVAGVSACTPGMASQAPASRQVAVARPDLFHNLLRVSRDLGPSPAGRRVSFLISLRDPSAKMRKAALAAMYDPRSPHFGTFESPRQWAGSGPTPSVVARARAYLRRRGVETRWHEGQDWMLLSGSVRAIEHVFRVHIHVYRFHGVGFFAAQSNARVPSVLASAVSSVGQITNYRDRHAAVVPANGLTPAGLRLAYDLAPLRSRHLDGSGETVSFIEIDGYHQQDFDAFTRKFGLPALHPILSAGPHLTNADGEAEMDFEVVHGSRLVHAFGSTTARSIARTPSSSVWKTRQYVRILVAFSASVSAAAKRPSLR